MVDVIHCIVSVPTSEDDHLMIDHNCTVPEPIQGKTLAIGNYNLPLMTLVQIALQ